MLSIVITSHNEGDELAFTVDSVRSSMVNDCQIIVVDEASSDGSCHGLEQRGVRVVRHENRVGVAASRDEGVRLATHHAVAFVDGHQRFSDGCLDSCAHAAMENQAIVWPDVGGLGEWTPIKHGASFCLHHEESIFKGRWRHSRPIRKLSRISSLRCPGYVMPRFVYERVRWIPELRGWGGTEAAISLKAFFLDVPILHLCGPLAHHMFKKSFQYEVTSSGVWRNHALIARVCFDDRCWFEYWLPRVFGDHLTDAMHRDLESSSVVAQQNEFQQQKVRTDREFWTRLLRMPVPKELRRTTVGGHYPPFRVPRKIG